MNEYNPDRWKAIKISHNGEIYCKIFATWGGGYLYGSSWKLSSGGYVFKQDGEYIVAPQTSGSMYNLHKNAEGICGMWGGLYADFIEKMSKKSMIEELSYEQLKEMTND